MSAPSGPFASQYINGVYIPVGLLIGGIAIIKREWLPYAVVVAVVLGFWKVYINSRGLYLLHQTRPKLILCSSQKGPTAE
jgi:hypothetical protein